MPSPRGATLIAAALFCVAAATAAFGAGEPVVGSIKAVQGNCSVVRASQTVSATQGMHLQIGDLLKTGSDGRLAFIMRDGTRVSLGPETELTVDQFAYDPSHGKFALLLNLGRGLLAYISGKIAGFSPEAVRVQTPVASIGIRGTSFVVGLGVSP
jgi:hypothetical protein